MRCGDATSVRSGSFKSISSLTIIFVLLVYRMAKHMTMNANCNDVRVYRAFVIALSISAVVVRISLIQIISSFQGLGLCVNHRCRPPTVCIVRSDVAVCECPECGDELNEVCASNGVTYANSCKLKQEACRHNVDIYQKYSGVCGMCVSHCMFVIDSSRRLCT